MKVFVPSFHHVNSEMMKRHLISKVLPLMHAQCTSAKWFTLRGFHLTATIACRIMNSKSTFSDMEKLSMLLDSWFTRWHSMEETKIGTKNEDAVLQALSCQELAD